MKRLLILLVGLTISTLNATAQRQEVCIPWEKIVIPIYANELSDTVICEISQDFDKEDHSYEVFIVKKSPLRFKIEYRDLDEIPIKDAKTGWIDKKYCGVYARWYYDNGSDQKYIKLYASPSKDSNFIKIYKSPIALTVVDFQDDLLEVMFEIDGTVYTGWVDRYCPNIFNSCT